MAVQYAYDYAIIDETGFCYEVRSTTVDHSDDANYIEIPEYSYDYIEKYYNVADGKWYYDAEFTNEWIPTDAE